MTPRQFTFRRTLGALILCAALCGILSLPAAAASSQVYAQLRLLVEALYEIDNKYVTEIKDRELIYGAIRGMVASLDPNSSFLSPAEYQENQHEAKAPEAEAGLALSVKDNILTVIAPVEGGPAWRSGISADDHILKINNQSTRNITAMEAARKLQGPPGTKVSLQLIRNGLVKPLDIELTLEKHVSDTVVHFPLEDGYHYIRLRTPRDRSTFELQNVLRSLQASPSPKKGIILDLRNTAGGRLEEARRLASVFVGSDLIYSTRGRQSDIKQPVTGLKEYQVLKEKLPLIVLMDQGTSRVAEIMAGVLQAHWGALLLGYNTFGDCSVTRLFPLRDGSALIVSVGHCYTPRDRLIQGKGLEPDIPGPKKDTDEQPISGSPGTPGKEKTLPNLNDVMQDPLVQQALVKLKSWGKSTATQKPDNRILKKKHQASSVPMEEKELS